MMHIQPDSGRVDRVPLSPVGLVDAVYRSGFVLCIMTHTDVSKVQHAKACL